MTINENNPQNESTRNGPPKMGGTFWFVVFHDDIDDRRLDMVAARAKVARTTVIGFLIVLKTHASRAADRGSVADFDIERCTLPGDLDEQTVRDLLAALKDKGFIVDGRIADWDRQPLRTDPTGKKRQAEWRERDKLSKAGSEDRNVTSRYVTPIVNHSESDHTELNRTEVNQTTSQSNTITMDSHRNTSDANRNLASDSEVACAGNESDSPSVGDNHQGSNNAILFLRPTIPPAVEETGRDSGISSDDNLTDSAGGKKGNGLRDKTTTLSPDSYSVLPTMGLTQSETLVDTPAKETTPAASGDSSELTLENLETLILPIFGDASIVDARNLLRASGPDAVMAVCREAESEPEVTRWRLMENAYADVLNAMHPGIKVGKVTGPLSLRDLTRRAAQKLGAKSTVHVQHLIALMDGDIDKALTAIEDATDGAAFDLAMERFASARPDVPVPSPWGDFSAAA